MERMTRSEFWRYFEHVLATSENAEKGHLACIDLGSGELVAGQASTDLLPVGWFDETRRGDGATKVRVRLFKEIELHRFANDTAPNDVQASDVGHVVYVKNGTTVSTLSTGRSPAGRVWAVTPQGVLVEPAVSIGIQGPQGPEGPPGS